MAHVTLFWRAKPKGLRLGDSLELNITTFTPGAELRVKFDFEAVPRESLDFVPNPPPKPPSDAPISPMSVEAILSTEVFDAVKKRANDRKGAIQRFDAATSRLVVDGKAIPLDKSTEKPEHKLYFVLSLGFGSMKAKRKNPLEVFIPCPRPVRGKAIKVLIDVEGPGAKTTDDFATELLTREITTQEKLQHFLHAQSKLVYGPVRGVGYSDIWRGFLVKTYWGKTDDMKEDGTRPERVFYNASYEKGSLGECTVCSPFTGHFLAYWYNCHGRAANGININSSGKDMDTQHGIFKTFLEPVLPAAGRQWRSPTAYEYLAGKASPKEGCPAAEDGDIFVCGSKGHTWLLLKLSSGFSVQKRYIFGGNHDAPDALCDPGIYKVHASFPASRSKHPYVGMELGYTKYLFDGPVEEAKKVLAGKEYKEARGKHVEPLEKKIKELEDSLKTATKPRKKQIEAAIAAERKAIAVVKEAEYRQAWISAEKALDFKTVAQLEAHIASHSRKSYVESQIAAAKEAGCDGIAMFASTPLPWMNARLREAREGELPPRRKRKGKAERAEAPAVVVYDYDDDENVVEATDKPFRMWKLARVLDDDTGWIDRVKLDAFLERNKRKRGELEGIELSDCRPMIYRRDEDASGDASSGEGRGSDGTESAGGGGHAPPLEKPPVPKAAGDRSSSPRPAATRTKTLADLLRGILDHFPDF